MSKPKTWCVVYLFMGELDRSIHQSDVQVMSTVRWAEFKDEEGFWKEKAQEFLETSRPGDILNLGHRMYVIRERPNA